MNSVEMYGMWWGLEDALPPLLPRPVSILNII